MYLKGSPLAFRLRTTLNNHLRKALATQCLAAHELLALQASQSVEESCNDEEHGGRDQARCAGKKTEPLDRTHDGIHRSAHPVGGEPANEGVELFGGRADSQQPGYFNKDEDKGRHTAHGQYLKAGGDSIVQTTYRQMILNTMRPALKEKMLAIPRAKHSTMHTTPVLSTLSQLHLVANTKP